MIFGSEPHASIPFLFFQGHIRGSCLSCIIPTMPVVSMIHSRARPSAFIKSEALQPSAPGSDQCSFSRSPVMRRAEPLGAPPPYIPLLPPLEKRATSPIKPPSTGTPIRHRIWSSHLAFRRLPSQSVPRVPEDTGERQGKIVS